QRASKGLEQALDSAVAEYASGDFIQQKIVREIENEDRAHSVIGEALPHLGGEQESQAAGVAEELRFAISRDVCRNHFPNAPCSSWTAATLPGPGTEGNGWSRGFDPRKSCFGEIVRLRQFDVAVFAGIRDEAFPLEEGQGT